MKKVIFLLLLTFTTIASNATDIMGTWMSHRNYGDNPGTTGDSFGPSYFYAEDLVTFFPYLEVYDTYAGFAAVHIYSDLFYDIYDLNPSGGGGTGCPYTVDHNEGYYYGVQIEAWNGFSSVYARYIW